MHMLWECPDVQDFWDMVLDVLYKVTKIHFPKDPVLFLLNDNSISSKREGLEILVGCLDCCKETFSSTMETSS